MGIDLVSWLIRELDERAWSHRELARRAGISQTTVSQVIAGQRQPTWDFCAVIADPLGVPVDEVFVRAGLKPSLPPAVEEERDAVAILRALPPLVRDTVMVQLRALVGQPTEKVVNAVTAGKRQPVIFLQPVQSSVHGRPTRWIGDSNSRFEKHMSSEF